MIQLKLTEGAEPAEVHPMRCAPVFDVYTASSAGRTLRWPVLVCAGPPAPEPMCRCQVAQPWLMPDLHDPWCRVSPPDLCSLHLGWATADGEWIDCTADCPGSRVRAARLRRGAAGPPAPEQARRPAQRHGWRLISEGSACVCGEYGCGELRIQADA